MKFRSDQSRAKYLAWYDDQAKKWPVPAETAMVETAYGSTFVRISGSTDAQPLVLLPGAHGSSLIWAFNIEMLAANHRVYTIDNIADYGRSVPTSEPRSADDFVRWLDQLLDGLGLGDGIALGGLSYGGWISSQYALAHPDRLRRVTLIAPAATVLRFSPMFYLRAIPAGLGSRRATRSFLRWLRAAPEIAGPPGDALVEYREASIGARSYKTSLVVAPKVLADDELSRLGRTPTLFLVGENERIYSADKAAQRIRRVAPEIQVEMVPEAGHLFTATHPVEVNERLLAFLK